MKGVYYTVTVKCESPLIDELLVIDPTLNIKVDLRTVEEIENSAVEKGFDVSYCSSFYGISEQRREELFKKVLRHYGKTYEIRNRYDLQLDILLRITVR